MHRKLFLTIAGIVFSGYLFLSRFPQTEELIRYVNPLIGTQEMGHTFPGACVPFGMVQLSPDTDTIPTKRTEI